MNKSIKLIENSKSIPRLRQTVKIRFWSLRCGIGPGYGIIFDVDTKVERYAYRMKIDSGWKWKIKGLNYIGRYDSMVYVDQEILDEYREDLEVEYVN